jgi:multiple sugar transport system substrate-binding protein/putative aldouronate transport system substrate-binding protein
MKLKSKAALAVALVLAAPLAACTTGGNTPDAVVEEFPTSWDKEITVDVFDSLANFQGIQEGWFAKIIKDKFNIKLNIIAPNVAGGGDTLYNTRVSAGDLGDLIVVNRGTQTDELIEGGLVMDMANYVPAMDNLAKYELALEHSNEGKDGTYMVPTSLSSIQPDQPSEGLDPTFGPYVRWDYYSELGYPEVGTLEDLLPLLKDMQDAHPTTADGKPIYGLSLFKDWDGNMMVMAKQPACFYGFDEMGFVLAQADGSEYQSIIDDDSAYVRSLKFFYEANQMGLVDPESTTQNYDTMYAKYVAGQVLFSPWPWLGQAAFNTDEHLQAGQGFQILPMQDQRIFSYGAEAYGAKVSWMIGSKAEDPERMAAFIDWLYSPEGAYANASQTGGSTGPEGMTWEVNGDGEPELTELGKQIFLTGDADIPEEFGGGKWKAGGSALNTTAILPADIDPATGFPYSYTFWPTWQAATVNPLKDDWSSHMDDATSTMEYLKSNDMVTVAPGAGYAAPADSSEIETLRNQVKAIIVQYSWQMSFAANQAEFDSLLAEMQEKAIGLGYDKVYEFDLENAKAQQEARVDVVKAFEDKE